MSVKKFATEVWQHVVANSFTYAVSTAVALGLPYWATIKEQLSWPLAASLAIVLFAATISVNRRGHGQARDARVPREMHHENVYRWYQLKNVLHATDPATGQVHDSTVATTIFVVFETPVLVHTLEVQSPDIRLPAYEVKEFNNRFAIIVFAGEVPMGTLEIVVHT